MINAAGNTTSHGGSTPTASVKEAMEATEYTWVDLQELLDASGARIAELLGVEAAYITSGRLCGARVECGRLYCRE